MNNNADSFSNEFLISESDMAKIWDELITDLSQLSKGGRGYELITLGHIVNSFLLSNVEYTDKKKMILSQSGLPWEDEMIFETRPNLDVSQRYIQIYNREVNKLNNDFKLRMERSQSEKKLFCYLILLYLILEDPSISQENKIIVNEEINNNRLIQKIIRE